MTQCWEPGTQYNYGDVVVFEGRKYKIIQPHRSQGDWTPPVTPALWGRLQDSNEGHNDHQQPQSQPPQKYDQEHKEESKFDQVKNWAHDHEHELKVGGGVLAGAAVLAGGAALYNKHQQEKLESSKLQGQHHLEGSNLGYKAEHKAEEAKSWVHDHEHQLKVAGGVLGAAAVAAGATAAYQHYQGEKADSHQDIRPDRPEESKFDQAKKWAQEHDHELKIAGGTLATAAAVGGAAYAYNQYKGKAGERADDREERSKVDQAKDWAHEHEHALKVAGGVAAGAAVLGGAAFAYKNHKAGQAEEIPHHQDEPGFSDKTKQFVHDHKAGLAVGAGALAAGAGYAAYKHHEKEKAERAEITHLEQQVNRLDLEEDKGKKLKIAGGVAAGAAVIGGGAYALHKMHEKKEEEQNTLANTDRKNWLADARERTDRFYKYGPSGPVTWVLAHGPQIPQGAIVVSRENTWNLYICRTYHQGGMQLGKASESFPKGAVIGYGGEEIHVDTYEILLGDMRGLRWVDARGRLNPTSLGYKPVEGGRESDGRRLYIAKAEYNGVFHPGKAGEDLDGALIPYGGTEQSVREYNVLCYNT